MVEAQTEFLRTAEELAVLERQYEQQKLKAVQRAQRGRLLLHGLSEDHVGGILANRARLKELTVAAPKEMPPDTSLKTSKEKAEKVAMRLKKIQGVRSFVARTGRAELDEHVIGANMSDRRPG